MLRHLKLFTPGILIAILLFTTNVYCIAQESKWVGEWSSNEFAYSKSNSSSAGKAKFSCNFYLCSDHYAFSIISMKMDLIQADIVHCIIETKYRCPGEWSDDGDLSIYPNTQLSEMEIIRIESKVEADRYNGRYLSSSEKRMVENELNRQLVDMVNNDMNINSLLDDNGSIPINSFKNNGMKLSKTAVQLPYYMLPNLSESSGERFEIHDDDLGGVPRKGLIRGVWYHPQDRCVEIGLFVRKESLTPFFTRTYQYDGSCTGFVDSEILFTTEKIDEQVFCNNYVDSNLCPSFGNDIFNFTNGTTYNGDWKDKKPNGNGRATMPNGDWKEGLWENGMLVEGKGKIHLPDDSYFEGDLKGDVADGYGVRTTNEGTFSGEWRQGVLAKGEAKLARDGKRLECEVQNGQLTGEGTMTTSNGSFAGMWVDGVFQEGTIIKNGSYQYTGSLSDTFPSFYEGECKLSDGNTFMGRWSRMKFYEGKVSIVNIGEYYPKFEGTIKDGKLADGSFQSKAGFHISSEWQDRTSSDKLTISFPNGDSVKGIWDVETGILVEASEFDYIWADGVKCSYIVGKKSKLTKASYTDSSGMPAKAKIAKGRIMMNTDGEAYTLHPIQLEPVNAVLNRALSLPE